MSDSVHKSRNMPRKLRILSLVHNLFYGGDQTRLLAFARCYDREHFDHVVASIHLPDDKYMQKHGSMREEFASHGVPVIELGRHHSASERASLNPFQLIATLRSLREVLGKLKQVIIDHQIDIIDARLRSPIFIGAVASRLHGIPSVGTTYSFEGNPSLLSRVVRQVSFGMSHAMITDSEYWQHRIKAAMISPWLRVECLPNGIFPPVVQRNASETRQSLGIPDSPDTRVVCQVSRLIEYKGHGVLLDAAKPVLERHPNAFFLLIGHELSPGYRQQLIEQSERLGIANRVRISAYDGSIGDVWNMVDIHAHASLLDSAPNAIIEGMSMGKPGVVTDVGGIPQLVEDEVTAIVVPAGEATAMANGISRLLDNPQTASSMGAAARARYEQQFTPELMARRHENLFREICHARAS